ncbi:MAG: S26 family signal peptidase [Pseudomonadota bacterium]
MSRDPTDLPLFAWARKLREDQAKRRCVVRRALWLVPLALGLTATIAFPPRPFLVWNTSESAPIGLYSVGAKDDLKRSDMVIAWVPESHRDFAAKRHYLPRNVPIVKRIAAVPGDHICAEDRAFIINETRIISRRGADRQGRELPWWQGCRNLRKDEMLLLMAHPSSFDGRYFGPTQRNEIVGKARLLWEK